MEESAVGPEAEQGVEAPDKKVIRCKTTAFERAQKQMSFALKVFSIVTTAVGALALVAYIIIGTVFEKEPIYANILLLSGAVIVAVGVIYIFSVNYRLKAARDLEATGTANEYEFYSDCLMVSSSKEGNRFGMSKIAYSSVVRVKETPDFLFICYPSRGNAYALEKSSLSHEEYDTVLSLLSRPTKYGSKPMELSAAGEWN